MKQIWLKARKDITVQASDYRAGEVFQIGIVKALRLVNSGDASKTSEPEAPELEPEPIPVPKRTYTRKTVAPAPVVTCEPVLGIDEFADEGSYHRKDLRAEDE